MSHQFLTHCILRIVTVMTFAATLCFSADVKVKGTVKDSDGKAIKGALVEVIFEKKTTRTNADGEFDFAHPIGVNSSVNALKNTMLSAHLKNEVLLLNIFKSGPVEITMYALNGKTVFSMQKLMDAGNYNIKLPLRGNGVYICRVKTVFGEMLLKNTPLGGFSAGSSIELSGIVTTTANKAANDPKPWHKDILLIKAPGFVDYDILVNNYDTNYKDIVMLTLADTVRDADGNLYQAVKIGDQIWTTSSLITTKFNDGTDIPRLQEASKWGFPCTPSLHMSWSKEVMETKAGWCIQHKKDSDKNGGPALELAVTKEWGYLYNWYAAMHSKIAPKGWHVPTRDELFKLRTYMVHNGYNFDEKKYPEWDVKKNDNKTDKADMDKNKCAKAIASRIYFKEMAHYRGTIGNAGNDIRTNNSSGFNCKPVGSRWCTTDYKSYEASCYLWSSSYSDEEIAQKPQGYHLSFHGENNFFGANDHETRTGFQIRILKDK